MLSIRLVCALLTNALIATRAAVPPAPTTTSVLSASPASTTADCLSDSLESNSVYCRGSRAIRNVIHNLSKNNKPLVLLRGLEIVPAKDAQHADKSSVLASSANDSFLGCVSEYLRTHELNIKFSDLLADESEQYFARDLERNGVKISSGAGAEEARKKDKGQGIILAMAMMFGKMMAVMGLGGIGALAMKALGVAMAALMMASMIGLKSLSQHGHENSHSVQYVTADGHHHKRRRRRSVGGTPRNIEPYDPLPLVYKGWQQRMK